DFSGALSGTGSYAPPKEARGGTFKGAGVGPSPAYSYSAQVAEVSVDLETGIVTVHKVWAAHDCGRALNPVSVEGQVIGSVWMGLGQALQEEMVWKDGLLMNAGLLEYRSPSAVESPEGECIIVESVDPEGPFGAKEASEGSLAATIPAIANAIYDAVGIRLREAPFTPERVLAAMRAKKDAAKKIDLTEGVDPTAPARFREHGGALWFRGKGPARHELDPARRSSAVPAAETGGDDWACRVSNCFDPPPCRRLWVSSTATPGAYKSWLAAPTCCPRWGRSFTSRNSCSTFAASKNCARSKWLPASEWN